MKTNTIQVIATTAITGLIVGFGSTKITGDALTGIAVTVSYLAVAAVLAIASVDYRSSQRAYKA